MSERRIPFVYATPATLGAQGPATLAGALVQENAEVLSALLIAQLTSQGCPFIRYSGLPVMDMLRGTASYSGPEFLLSIVAGNELGHYYGLPIFTFGGCSDSKVFDQQASMEGALSMLAAAMSGGNLIHDIGFLDLLCASSFELVVSMDEMAGWVKAVLGGLWVSGEALALDAINRVGPGGEFVSDPHTLRHFRSLWRPTLIDRSSYGVWSEQGGLTLGERAKDKVREILEGHKPKPLDDDVRRKLSSILTREEQQMKSTSPEGKVKGRRDGTATNAL
jgi:trimethylamine--corrinoid protein Co-methyltransferase